MQDPRHSGLGSGGPTVVAGALDGVGLGFGLLGCMGSVKRMKNGVRSHAITYTRERSGLTGGLLELSQQNWPAVQVEVR